MPRRFTPKEANDELREIRPLVEELVSHRSEQQRLEGERLELTAKIAGNGGGIDAQAISGLEQAEQRERIEIARCVNEIHGRGVIVKDVDEGLVDFPALRHGEEILLCWRLGEDEVAHWHGLEEGFAGRKQLDPE
jgi:hypothetical protein